MKWNFFRIYAVLYISRRKWDFNIVLNNIVRSTTQGDKRGDFVIINYLL